MIQTDNANNTATVGQMAIENLPNPGSDLTFAAQVVPGATMNTSGGYGNVEFNGLPAESTNFTIDGIDANDPFLNLNNSGATDLQLGLNDIQETTVNTLSYSVDQGRQGAAQVNYISKSGGNKFHGNAYEIWNGSKHERQRPVPEYAGSAKALLQRQRVRGQHRRTHQEGQAVLLLRLGAASIVLPVSATDVITPTTAMQNATLTALRTGATYNGNPAYYDPLNTTQFGPMTNSAPALDYYNKIFGVYGNHGGSPSRSPAAGSTRSNAGRSSRWLKWSVGQRIRQPGRLRLGNFTSDRLWTARIDQHIGVNDQLWYKVSNEVGMQATGTDPLNSAFNPYSPQPQTTAAMGWTHTFGPSLVNEFNPGFFWYSAIFGPDFQKALAVSPYEYDGPFTPIWYSGGEADQLFPEGRRVTNWQLIDNLTWTHGRHSFKFGENLRRTLMSDFDPSAGIAPDITC